MLKLMKYEMRKSRFSKIVMLVALAIAELVFLYGVNFTNMEKSPAVALGVAGLILVTVIGLSFIGIESLLTLHKDLNTKQSYMLFMTPYNSYQILGAKILENALAIFVCSSFFLILAAIDISILLVKLGGIKEAIMFLQQMMNIEIDWHYVGTASILAFLEAVISWFSMVVTGYLAIVLATAILAGKKLSGVVAFIFYLILVALQTRVVTKVVQLVHLNSMELAGFGVYGVTTLILGILLYLVSCLLLEKKLSV